MGQEQERQHLNMTQTSSISVGQDRRNQQQWSHHPEKEARIHQNMTNVSVISAPAKPDEPALHGRYNNGKVSNHERINDQCKAGNKMINDDNQRDLNMQFYETSRCYNQSETNVMSVYRPGDSVSNQPLTSTACGLSTTTLNNCTFLFRVLLCSTNLPVLVPDYIA